MNVDISKFKGSYLDELDADMISIGFVARTFTYIVYRVTVSKDLELTGNQLKELVEDIKIAKILGYWNKAEEYKTLEDCKRIHKHSLQVEALSPSDREIYNKELSKREYDFTL